MTFECVYRQVYPTRAAARVSIFEYIEAFYNRQRRHSTIGYQTPDEFERLYYTMLNRVSDISGKGLGGLVDGLS
jgi:transposase InsO family protein